MEAINHKEVAVEIMKIIMQDNGAMNSLEKERYPAKHIKAISNASKYFFGKRPDLLNQDFLELMCAGDQEEFDEKYSHIPFVDELQEAINNYFEDL